MNKGKILVFLRVSTESQDLQEQKNEMIEFVGFNGYSEEDIIFLEEKGASAIKLNDKYMAMVNTLLSYINNKEVNCVAIWSVNRILRDEEIYPKIKKALVENKVQLLIKNPSLALLNPDGSINQGSELALSLFSTMATQEMRERKEKFRRTKKTYAAQGKYCGGRTTIKFGYAVDSNKYFIPDEVESEIVKLIFQLYSTGDYSTYSLACELNSRGYTKRGKPFDGTFVGNLIKSKHYTGQPDEKWNNRVYPPIISEEIFEKCRSIADKNKLILRQGKKMVLCSRLVKCSECNHVFISSSKHFRCNGADRGICSNNITLRESVVDYIAWRVAFDEHIKYLIEVSENNTQTYNERLEVIDQKINTINNVIADSYTKKKRIVDTYLEGFIDKKERDLRLSKLQDDILIYQKDLSALNEEKSAILGLLENVSKEKDEWLYFDTLDAMNSGVKSDEDRYRILHQHILKIIPHRYQYGEKSKKAKKENAIMIEIYTVKGDIHKFIYLPSEQKGNNLLTYHNDKELWLGERI